MRRMTNEEAILNLKTIFAKYKFSEEESKSILKSFSVLFYNSVGAPLTLEQLCEMEGEKVILYRMKSTEPLEPGTVKRNGDVLGDFGMLAYHELYLETWVAFSYHSCHIKKEEQKAEWKEYAGADAGFHYCSKCKKQAFNYGENEEIIEVLSDFCPLCGSKRLCCVTGQGQHEAVGRGETGR